MKRLAQVVLSACLSLVLMAGVSATFTGCSVDTLSGPDFEANATSDGGGTSGSGSYHNTDKDSGDGGGTSGSGSHHNTDG